MIFHFEISREAGSCAVLVMDPFAALNVAANIIQFVGYTRDVYTQIREIRMSAAGMTKKDADVIWSASELHGMVDTISSGIEPLEKAPTAAERKIHDLGRRCQELSKTISADIEQKRAKSQSNVFSAAKVVLRMKWKTSEIDDKLAELNDIQDVLFKNLIIHIRWLASKIYTQNEADWCKQHTAKWARKSHDRATGAES